MKADCPDCGTRLSQLRYTATIDGHTRSFPVMEDGRGYAWCTRCKRPVLVQISTGGNA